MTGLLLISDQYDMIARILSGCNVSFSSPADASLLRRAAFLYRDSPCGTIRISETLGIWLDITASIHIRVASKRPRIGMPNQAHPVDTLFFVA